MAEPFLGEIKLWSFNFAPRDWAFCNGQDMPIDQNPSLYALLGLQFGGDGRTTFKLPDLRGRTPVHRGDGLSQGHIYGAEYIQLLPKDLPAHRHTVKAATSAGKKTPNNTFLGQKTSFGPPENLTAMNQEAVTKTGNSSPHYNMMPYLAINFCIALQGLFPSRN